MLRRRVELDKPILTPLSTCMNACITATLIKASSIVDAGPGMRQGSRDIFLMRAEGSPSTLSRYGFLKRDAVFTALMDSGSPSN